ncbi:MAG: hypothetical protein U1F61_09945 [Opitutaceae bacterium]
MPNLGNLPEKLILHPVQPVPLPKNYRFSVSFVTGWLPPRKDLVRLFIGDMDGVMLGTQDQAGPNGFNTMLAAILGYAAQNNLWGQAVPCQAVALALDGWTMVAKSNVQTLTLPCKPCSITHNLNLAYGVTDTPAPVGMTPPNGRRAYYRCDPGGAPSTIPKVWYITPDLRLEETTLNRGFDRFTFWLAVYGVAPKLCVGVTNGTSLAQRLNANKSPVAPSTCTLATLAATVGANLNSLAQSMMWTANRVVFLQGLNQPALMAMEFNALGFHKEPLVSWLANEDQSVVWDFRRLYGAPAPIWGLAGLA